MINQFYIIFLGIILGAFPFIVLGVILATIIQLYSRDSWYSWILKRNIIVSHILMGLFGLFIPVCECGNIPILKKLLGKGFSFSHAITFLLAAPIVNPVTIFTSYQAFKDYPGFIGFRIVGGLVIAIVLGLIFHLNNGKNDQFLLDPAVSILPKHEHCDHNHHTHHVQQRWYERLKDFAQHYTDEFIHTTKYLVIGAFLAAFLQVIIPNSWIELVSQNPISSLFAMMLFAFIISVCSNIDAFIGLSLIQSFSVNSILGFLVFGPMIDVKTVVMLKNIFTAKFISLLTLMTASATVLLVGLYYIANTFNLF
jgi:uncharacterized protein